MDVKQIAEEVSACPSLTDSNYYNDCTDIRAKISLTKEVIRRCDCGLRDAKNAVELSWKIVNDKSPRRSLQVQRAVLRDAIAELERSPYARATHVREGVRALRELDEKIGVELQGSEVHP